MESILTDILMKVSDVVTHKTTLRVSDVLTHPGQRCPDTCQLIFIKIVNKKGRFFVFFGPEIKNIQILNNLRLMFLVPLFRIGDCNIMVYGAGMEMSNSL
jgi:hypothetical protein